MAPAGLGAPVPVSTHVVVPDKDAAQRMLRFIGE
jgi:hypothetical protein